MAIPMPMQPNNAGYDVQPQLLPVGFVFKPTHVELLDYYLFKKLAGQLPPAVDSLIKERDIYQHDPHNLLAPGESFPFSKNNQMYFFSKRHRTSSGSNRVDRNTPGGFWDCRSRDYAVENSMGQVIGHRVQFTFKTFPQNSLKKRNRKEAIKTDWLMQEYRLKEQQFDDVVLCKIYKKDVAAGTAENNNEERGQRVEDQATMSPPLTSSADAAGYDIGQPPSSSASITSVCDDGYRQFLADDDDDLMGTLQQWVEEYLGDETIFLDDHTTPVDHALVSEENGERAAKRHRVLQDPSEAGYDLPAPSSSAPTLPLLTNPVSVIAAENWFEQIPVVNLCTADDEFTESLDNYFADENEFADDNADDEATSADDHASQ